MSSVVLMANILGMVSGEWTELPRSPDVPVAGLALLLIAIAALGYTSQMASNAGA